jgi:hypothetical protein
MLKVMAMPIAVILFLLSNGLFMAIFGGFEEKREFNLAITLLPFIIALAPSYYIGNWLQSGDYKESMLYIIPSCIYIVFAGYLYTHYTFDEFFNSVWVLLYVAGIIVATLLFGFNFLYRTMSKYITGHACMNKHLRNLYRDDPSEASWQLMFGISMMALLTSWVWVAVLTFELISFVFKQIASLTKSKPEKLKEIQLPLLSNPNLQPERAWAHLIAQGIIMGFVDSNEQLPSELENDLRIVARKNNQFNKLSALEYLENIGIIKTTIIERTKMLIEDN